MMQQDGHFIQIALNKLIFKGYNLRDEFER